jgi:RNA polymerase sigma-70 factor (ECF subfamily)
MNKVQEKFFVFMKASFGEGEKKELYEFIWKNYRKKISFYISTVVPYRHFSFDDLFQEVMLKIYNTLHTFNPLHSFKAWIYQIARRQCLDFIKRKDEKRSALRDGDPDRISADADPEETAIREEMFERIDRFLQSLEPLDREISYLRFYENLSYRKIAAIAHLRIGSVRSKLHQVKSKMKKQLYF